MILNLLQVVPLHTYGIILKTPNPQNPQHSHTDVSQLDCSSFQRQQNQTLPSVRVKEKRGKTKTSFSARSVPGSARRTTDRELWWVHWRGPASEPHSSSAWFLTRQFQVVVATETGFFMRQTLVLVYILPSSKILGLGGGEHAIPL